MGRTMKSAYAYIEREFQENKVSMTTQQWVFMRMMLKLNGSTQSAIAESMERDKTSIARMISTLERKNLLARIPCQQDRRVNQIFLTKNGEALINGTFPVMKNIIDSVERGLTKKERAEFVRILDKIKRNLEVEKVAYTTK